MQIVIIQTGGTIDKDYPRVWKGYGFEITEPAAQRILERVGLSFDYRILSLMRKDSQDLTDADRLKMVEICRDMSEKNIVITHGTDTMIETGLFISAYFNEPAMKNKKIILTGAMRPERFYDSDAAFQLGTAVGALEWIFPGVYIAMHGRVIPCAQAGRNPETGRFYRR